MEVAEKKSSKDKKCNDNNKKVVQVNNVVPVRVSKRVALRNKRKAEIEEKNDSSDDTSHVSDNKSTPKTKTSPKIIQLRKSRYVLICFLSIYKYINTIYSLFYN